jgi:phospholipid/cholesterol/gamma-HCH transport system permease protein
MRGESQHSLNKEINKVMSDIGGISEFLFLFFKNIFKPPYEFKEVLRQSYIIGYKSLPLVGLTAFIIGLVFTIQSRPTLVEFGAESMLPTMVAISIVREIGPIITAMVCAGKIGSSIGAELGSMKVTEQIDAMEVSGINPFKYIVITRITSATLMIPLLVIFADAIALYGCYLGVNIRSEISMQLFITKVFDAISFGDLIPSVVKSFFFGNIIGLVGCYKGYYSNKGTEGVGEAANSAVVTASVLVFIIDLIAAQLTDLLNLT